MHAAQIDTHKQSTWIQRASYTVRPFDSSHSSLESSHLFVLPLVHYFQTMRAAAAILSFLPTALSFATTKSSVSLRASSNLMAKLGDSIDFAKYEGLGNDFILIDDRDKSDPSLTPEQSERLCNRNFGIGGDGVIFALKAPEGKTC